LGKNCSFPTFVYLSTNTPGGAEHIVQWAKKIGKRVRVIGYQHSWTNLFGENGDVLISLFSIRVAESYPASHPPYDPEGNVFERIELLEEGEIDGQKYGFLKLGAGVTNYQLREWTHQNQFSDGSGYYFPLNVVLTETIGGSTAASCHGAGFNNKTISDLVVKLEFVNVHGVRQTVKGPEAREFIG
jgi:FAD/FMN-containing dehydrogenase